MEVVEAPLELCLAAGVGRVAEEQVAFVPAEIQIGSPRDAVAGRVAVAGMAVLQLEKADRHYWSFAAAVLVKVEGSHAQARLLKSKIHK